LELALLEPTVVEPLVSLVKLETVASIAVVLLDNLTLKPVAPVLVVSLTFLPFAYSFSSSYPKQWLYYTIV